MRRDRRDLSVLERKGLKMASGTSSPTWSPVVVTALVVATIAVAIAASRLAFVLTHPQPKTALYWLLLAGVVLVVVWLYCHASDDSFSWMDDRIATGTAAFVMICIAASRLTPPFLNNPQPRTAFWWLVAALILLLVGLIFGEDETSEEVD